MERLAAALVFDGLEALASGLDGWTDREARVPQEYQTLPAGRVEDLVCLLKTTWPAVGLAGRLLYG
jgi:hypothetical protein